MIENSDRNSCYDRIAPGNDLFSVACRRRDAACSSYLVAAVMEQTARSSWAMAVIVLTIIVIFWRYRV